MPDMFPSQHTNPMPTLQVFFKDGRLYGFKGLAGKLGPIGVHASMLLCMAGFAGGAREWHDTNGSNLLPAVAAAGPASCL